jgi:hypothetical protein
MTVSASIKVCDPVSVPVSFLADLSDLRAELKGLRQENERLRLDNERLQRELAQAKVDLDQARRQSKRQAAPFSKGGSQSPSQNARSQTRPGSRSPRPPPASAGRNG